MIDNADGAGSSSIMNMAAQFGFGNVSGNGIDENKLVDIAKTTTVIKNALLLPDKDNCLANDLQNIGGFLKIWKKRNPNFKAVDFTIEGQLQDSLLIELVNNVRSKYLTIDVLKSGIVSVKVKHENESIALDLNNRFVDAVSNFFEDKAEKKNRITYQKLSKEMDSIKCLLGETEEAYALAVDNSLATIQVKGKLKELRLKRDLDILNVMYQEGIKNLEMAKFNMLDKRSLLHVIDRPVSPLPVERLSPLILGVLLGVFGFCLSCSIVIFRQFISEISSEAQAIENS